MLRCHYRDFNGTGRHMVDIPRIIFFAQRGYRAKGPFMGGHEVNRESHDAGFSGKIPFSQTHPIRRSLRLDNLQRLPRRAPCYPRFAPPA